MKWLGEAIMAACRLQAGARDAGPAEPWRTSR